MHGGWRRGRIQTRQRLTAYVEVHPDLSGFADEAKAKIDAATRDLSATAKLTADDSDLTAKTAEATSKVDEFGAKTGTARLGADTSGVDEGVASADAKVDDFAGKDASARLGVDEAGVDEGIASADAKVDEFGAKDARARVGVDDGDSNPVLDEIIAKLDEINGKRATATVDINSSGSGLSGLFSGGLTSPGGIAGMLLGGGALLPALPGALAGGTAAAGTLGLAIAGVSKALSDYSSGAKASTSATNSMASSQLSSAHTIATAQQAVSQAETQAQHDAITSAEAIRNAQTSLTAAYQQAAQQRISAEQQLQSAEYSETQAQNALNSARQQAVLTIQQLNNAAADANLNAQQDRLNLEQAQQTQAQVDANSKSTALQRAQAALAVKEAEQALKEALEGRTNSAKAAQKADQEGVAHNPQVLAAEHALQQAKQAVANAQRNLAQVEESSARSIAAAQQAVADAQRNARWQQVADSNAVRNAQENLKYAYASAGLAAGGAAKATSAYAQDLAKLTPAGRQFVTAITGAMSSLHGLEGAAEKALLPGLEAILRGVKSIAPEITREVGQMGGLLSHGFSVIGRELASSGFQKELHTLFTEGNRFIAIMGPAVNRLVLAFMKMGTEGGPALTGLARGLSAILGGVGKLFTTLGKFSAAGGSILQTLGKAIGAIGGPLGTVIGVLLKAFAPLLKDMLPLFKSLLGQIARIVVAAGPGLLAIGNALGQMLLALTPLAPQLGTLVVDLVKLADAALIPLLPVLPQLIPPLVQILSAGLKPMTTLLPVLTPLIGGLAKILAALISGALVPVVGAMADVYGAVQNVISGFISAVTSVSNIKDAWNDVASFTSSIWGDIASFFTSWWQSIEAAWKTDLGFVTGLLSDAWNGITGTVKSVWNAISSWFSNWWGDLKSAWKADLSAIGGVLSGAWNGIESTVKTVWGKIASFFSGFWRDLKSGASAAVGALGTAWGHIENVFRTPVNFLISKVYMGGIRRLWDDVVGAIGLSKLDLPAVSSLAQGGKITQGTGPTADDVLARVSKDETVVSAAHSKILAPAFAAVGVPGYAGGGIPNPITGITHLISGAIDVGKIVAALATGNTTAFANALTALVKTNASGQYATLMTKAPEKLISDIVGGAASKLSGSAASSGAGGTIGPYGKGVAQWRPDVLKVLAMLNQPASDVGVVLSQMTTESGGNPLAVNKWDSNWAAGHPSVGLMQVIAGTFDEYAGRYRSTGPFEYGVSVNPMANIYAGLNYAIHRYKGNWTQVLGHGHGYDQGGWLKPGGIPVNGLRKPEAVLTPDESAAFIQLVKGLVASGSGGAGQTAIPPGGRGPVVVNFNGSTLPTPEQEQALMLKLSAAIGVA